MLALNCSAGTEQPVLVAMSPSLDTSDAVQPPRLTTAPSTPDVGLASAAGSISSPSALSVDGVGGDLLGHPHAAGRVGCHHSGKGVGAAVAGAGAGRGRRQSQRARTPPGRRPSARAEP